MIKCNKGMVEINGNERDLSAEVSIIIQAMYEVFMENGDSSEVAKKKIQEAVKIGLMSDEEREEEIEKKKKLIKLTMGSLFGGLFE